LAKSWLQYQFNLGLAPNTIAAYGRSLHTPRHLCLTDLARANWDIHEIAKFAGHRSIQSTLLYVHLSGRDLAEKLERGMASIHQWRVKMISDPSVMQ